MVYPSIKFKTIFHPTHYFSCNKQKNWPTLPAYYNFRVYEAPKSSVQLNEYETVPYFIQFSQNLTCECLLISMVCPKFT